jgi:DNA-binding NtrC family response regulator
VKILLADDEANVRRVVRRLLSTSPDLEIAEASSVTAALAQIEADAPDLLLLDLYMGDQTGLDLLRELRKQGRAIPAVMITSSRELDDLREAMRLGASDYVFKDELSAELLMPIVDGYKERLSLGREVVRLRTHIDRSFGVRALVGRSAAMERLRKLVVRLADAETPVLVRGQTGSGKELVSRALHQQSKRREEPFVALNCSAMPGQLIESMLFGHEKGAFTGADRRQRGHFELVGEGTLLLDEVAELPFELQAKLLRVLEDRKFRPLGSEKELPLRARLVAATHVDLEARIKEKQFREDLYYRLNVVTIQVPRLDERIDDLPELIATFVERAPRPLKFTPGAMSWLAKYPWSGNVRELRNVIERLALLADEDLIDERTLEEIVAPERDRPVGNELARFAAEILAMPTEQRSKLELAEGALIRSALDKCAGNVSAAARLLGVPRGAIRRRIEGTSTSADDDD